MIMSKIGIWFYITYRTLTTSLEAFYPYSWLSIWHHGQSKCTCIWMLQATLPPFSTSSSSSQELSSLWTFSLQLFSTYSLKWTRKSKLMRRCRKVKTDSCMVWSKASSTSPFPILKMRFDWKLIKLYRRKMRNFHLEKWWLALSAPLIKRLINRKSSLSKNGLVVRIPQLQKILKMSIF